MDEHQDRTTGSGQEEGGWKYSPSDAGANFNGAAATGPSPARPASAAPEVEWSASEFVAHHKSASWYVLLFLAAAAAAGIVYFITHDIVSSSVIIIVAVLFGVTAAHKPRVLNYRLDSNGLGIGQKFYPYGLFKAFSVVDEGSFSNITFVPLKRFMPGISIYYDPQDEEKIINALTAHLPMEQVSHDTFDRLMRKVRF